MHDATALVADSGEESEDEWNYYKGDVASKDNINQTDADKEVKNVLVSFIMCILCIASSWFGYIFSI